MRPVTRFLRSPRRACGFVLGLVAVAAAAAEDGPVRGDLRPAWRLGAQTRFNEAEAAVPAEAKDEESAFARAVLLFNCQPRTASRMSAAIASLSALAGNARTPELRARSLYFWARAEDLRQLEGSPGAAAELYERLWREVPAQPWGQRALVHRLLLAFYGSDPREVRLARCAALEAEAGALSDAVVRSQFHQVAARGYLHLGGEDARALRHLLLVEQIGVARREAIGDLEVSIGQLGAELGRIALAREHYAAFLREFPHDPRAYTVQALLAALPAGEGAGP